MALTLITPPTDLPFSLDEAKKHLRVTGDDDDDLITTYLHVARNLCENRIKRALVPQVWELTLDLFPEGAIRLARPPVVEILEIGYIQDPSEEEVLLDTADYFLDNRTLPGWVMLAPDLTWPTDVLEIGNAVRVSFECGYGAGEIPEQVVQWMKLVLGDLYANRERSGDPNSIRLHEYSDELIHPYRVIQL